MISDSGGLPNGALKTTPEREEKICSVLFVSFTLGVGKRADFRSPYSMLSE